MSEQQPPARPTAASRRDFLRDIAVLGLGGWALGGCAARTAAGAADATGAVSARASGAGAGGPVRPTLANIGLGLYTVAAELREDFEGTLEQVARIGYRQVEFAGYHGRTPEQVRALLDRLGLTAPSTHLGLDLLRGDLETQVRTAQVVGHRYLTVPSLPRSLGTLTTVADWQRVAAEFNRLGRTVADRGLRLAFHNHSSEFVDVGGGRKGMDVFIAETDPALVSFQLDLGWAVVAGEDPVRWFARHPGRFTLWHVKDMKGLAAMQARQAALFRGATAPAPAPAPGAPPSGPAPLGEGDIDYGPILAAWRQSGLEHYFVEQDNAARWPGGALASLRSSYEHARRLLG